MTDKRMTDREVLISVRPKYCKLIANGEKTIEVRKTRPRITTPFKCYIYCTKGGSDAEKGQLSFCGRVIEEFVCNAIFPIAFEYLDAQEISEIEVPLLCLTDKQIISYLGNGKVGFGWNISDLVIYDDPKRLSEFGLERPPQSWCYVPAGRNK